MPPISLQFLHPHPRDSPQSRLHTSPPSLTPLSCPFRDSSRTSHRDSSSPRRPHPLLSSPHRNRPTPPLLPFHQSARVLSQSPAHRTTAPLIPSLEPWAEHRARQLPLADWPLALLTSANRVDERQKGPIASWIRPNHLLTNSHLFSSSRLRLSTNQRDGYHGSGVAASANGGR